MHTSNSLAQGLPQFNASCSDEACAMLVVNAEDHGIGCELDSEEGLMACISASP